jgi:hypothetical protein
MLLDSANGTIVCWTGPVEPLTAEHNERDHRLLDQRDHRANVAETISRPWFRFEAGVGRKGGNIGLQACVGTTEKCGPISTKVHMDTFNLLQGSELTG